MDKKQLFEQLKSVKHENLLNPDSSWVSDNKHKLLSQIANTTTTHEAFKPNMRQHMAEHVSAFGKVFLPHNFSMIMKPVVTAVIALVLTTGGWIASAYAQPGDALWSAKAAFNSALENGKLAITSEEDEAPLKLEFASKRAQLLKEVVASTNTDPEKKKQLVKKTTEDLKAKLDSAQESVEKTPTDKAKTLLKDVSLKTKEISKTLKEASLQTKLEDEELSQELSKQAVDASKQSLELVEVVLQKKQEADDAVSEEEKIIIKDHLDETVKTIQEETDKIVETSKNADMSGQDVSGIVPGTTTDTSAQNATEKDSTTASANVVKTPTQTESGSTQNIAQKVEAVVKAVEEVTDKTHSIGDLVDTDTLSAVKKVIEVNNLVKEVSVEVQTTTTVKPTNTTVTTDTQKVGSTDVTTGSGGTTSTTTIPVPTSTPTVINNSVSN